MNAESRPAASVASRYLSGARWEAIFTTCVWSSVSQASTPKASASERPFQHMTRLTVLPPVL